VIEVSSSTLADPIGAGLDPRALDRLRAVFNGLIERKRLPGIVLMIARKGVVGCLESLGQQDAARGVPMRLDSIFRIYSMTKPLVSAAALMLLEEGRLLLTDPVAKYLPEFAATRVGVERNGSLELVAPERPMTLHDLLRHTAGLSYEILPPNAVRRLYAEAKVNARDIDNAEMVRRLASLPLMHQPGSVWEYSRATDVLGRVLELVCGQSLGEVLRVRILGPLGMQDTAFHVAAASHGRIAEPFAHDPDSGDDVQLIDIRNPRPMQSGGGGLASTLPDYARFVELLSRGGERGGVRLLGRKTVEFMRSDHLGAIRPSSDFLAPGHGFGLGVAVRLASGLAPTPGSPGSCYWGGIAGTMFFVDPAEELFAVMLTQAPGQRDEFRALFRNLVHAALAP
jgi:CubicO group peptidase (beta-lactamase class C family)